MAHRKALTPRLPDDIATRLTLYCALMGRPASDLVTMLLGMYVRKPPANTRTGLWPGARRTATLYRVPADLHDDVTALAAARRVSVQQIVEDTLYRFLGDAHRAAMLDKALAHQAELRRSEGQR